MLVAKSGLEKVQTQLTLVAIRVSGEPPKSERIQFSGEANRPAGTILLAFCQHLLAQKCQKLS